MIKIRIEGKLDDLLKISKDFENDDEILSISRIYPNRNFTGVPLTGRIYIDYDY